MHHTTNWPSVHYIIMQFKFDMFRIEKVLICFNSNGSMILVHSDLVHPTHV